MINALSVDVEDLHCILARDWLGREIPPNRAVVVNTTRLLTLFAERGVHGTFFVLGEIAEAFPQLVRDIAAGGHELGVHGYYHRQVFKLTPEQFREEITRAKKLIEDISGRAILGHRAPAFSILPQTRWALDILVEEGFRYDSSISPIRGRRYGWPDFPPDIHMVNLESGRKLVEAPLSVLSVLGKRLPACGGGYLRHLPMFYTLLAMCQLRRRRPAIVYLHPCEIETLPYPLDTSGLSVEAAEKARRFLKAQMRNRHTVEGKLVHLLSHYPFAPLGEVIELVLPGVLK